ncbi:MAG: alanine--tRNA ligase [Anaerolineales bacterium]|nr:alanine--tRNA ligase [Anaerolineales bacterium]
MTRKFTGVEIRQTFIDYFTEVGHTFVPSASLVPGGDQTLLFTNAGMVQFKDVFLGTDKRPYKRAANSQKCMRVAGKHNDLEDVGRDDTHHTFFEMLGNWSFGDYYKPQAIEWAWDLLTNVWGLPKERMWATCFRDDKGNIPQDDEAAEAWRAQPGFDPSHVLFFGRKDNFWEMAEIGPCGPCSEIHFDRGISYCDKQHVEGHVCSVNGDCQRFLELWNLVFIQYNRLDAIHLEPLPAKHVDTGMGFERIVSVLQDVDSNYRTDLFWPLIETTQQLTGHSSAEVEENFTPYRVIADHARAASFLVADGVVPGNLGRNYITRMIIRRAYRFGGKIGLHEPFLGKVAEKVIKIYGEVYPELVRHQSAVISAITREEEQFQRTLDRATAQLENLLNGLQQNGQRILSGEQAADLYTTYGMPFEITRDIARERGLDVDEAEFHRCMDEHRLASGAGKAMGALGGEGVDVYRALTDDLHKAGSLPAEGVAYDPYTRLEVQGTLLALIHDGQPVSQAQAGDVVEVLLPETCFYVESGGQVSDTGVIHARDNAWEIQVEGMRKPAAGIIVHTGTVIWGSPKIGDPVIAVVDAQRRRDIMRNHTATHLLHTELRAVLGIHARQAGSLVAPDRLRFDFTHPDAVTPEQLQRIEAGINRRILGDYSLKITLKPLQQAINEGAMALFGEKYAETVRTITIGGDDPFSYELCGGTHVDDTGDIGICLITSEGSVAAGIRRIEAVTGRGAYELVQHRFSTLSQAAALLGATPDLVPQKAEALLSELNHNRKQIAALRQSLVAADFERAMGNVTQVSGVHLLTATLGDADADTLRQMIDRFENLYPANAVIVVAGVSGGRPTLVAAVTSDLVARGLNASELVRHVAAPLGGGGGGKPTLAQAGGKDASQLPQALQSVAAWVSQKISQG